MNLEIEHRRDLLGSMIAAPEDPLRLSPLLQAPPEQVLEAVRKLGLEGVIGKRMNSVYEPGERSGAWIKHRTNLEQEFVIGGYIPGACGFGADGRVAPGSRLCSQRTLSSRSLASDPGGEEPGTHACKGKNACKAKAAARLVTPVAKAKTPAKARAAAPLTAASPNNLTGKYPGARGSDSGLSHLPCPPTLLTATLITGSGSDSAYRTTEIF